MQILSFASFP